jgi:hypothetical protein
MGIKPSPSCEFFRFFGYALPYGYFEALLNDVTDEAIMESIRHQAGTSPDCGVENCQVATS